MNDKEFIATLKQKRQLLTEQLAALDLLMETCSPQPATTHFPTITEAFTPPKVKPPRKQSKPSLAKWGNTPQYVSFVAKEISAIGGMLLCLATLAERYWKVYHADVQGNGKPIMAKFKASFGISITRYCQKWTPKMGPHLNIFRKEGSRLLHVEVMGG